MNGMRFIFERDFDRELEIERGETPLPERVYSESVMQAELDAAKAAAFAEGHDLGFRKAEAAAVSEAERRNLAAVERIGERLEILIEAEAEHRKKLEREVVDLIHAILERILPRATAALAQDRLRDEILAHLHMALGAKTLRIKLSGMDLPPLKETILQEAEKLGVGQRVEISSDAGLSTGDCRIEWGDGFMEYGFTKVCQQLLLLLQAAPEEADAGNRELKQSYA